MRILIDNKPHQVSRLMAKYDFIGGQLLTPLTRNADAGGVYGIDNGAFSRFNAAGFERLLERQSEHRHRCLFVALPDVVASARRTLEVFNMLCHDYSGWARALVAQDGLEDLDIPWNNVEAVFIGGSTEWKDSKAAADICKAAKILGRHVHVGRVNTPRRYEHFQKLGAHTCDGSGVSRFDHMLDKIQARLRRGGEPTLFDSDGGDEVGGVENGLSCNDAADGVASELEGTRGSSSRDMD